MSVAKLQAKLETRRDRIARLEQERADLRIEVETFRKAYSARLGPLQTELDTLELRTAEYRVRNALVRLRGNGMSAGQLEAEVERQLRDRRRGSSKHDWPTDPTPSAATAEVSLDPPAPDPELKLLYRELAKRAHPDLAFDEDDRAERGRLMAEINAAYARSDSSALRAIGAGLNLSGGTWADPDDAGWLRGEIARLDEVAAALRAEIAELNRSDWMAMKLDASLARARGIDWFGQARQELETRIAGRRVELDRLIDDFRDLVRQAGLA